jgi:hypothetical protein
MLRAYPASYLLSLPLLVLMFQLFSCYDGQKLSKMRSEPNRFAFARRDGDRRRARIDGPGSWYFA